MPDFFNLSAQNNPIDNGINFLFKEVFSFV